MRAGAANSIYLPFKRLKPGYLKRLTQAPARIPYKARPHQHADARRRGKLDPAVHRDAGALVVDREVAAEEQKRVDRHLSLRRRFLYFIIAVNTLVVGRQVAAEEKKRVDRHLSLPRRFFIISSLLIRSWSTAGSPPKSRSEWTGTCCVIIVIT